MGRKRRRKDSGFRSKVAASLALLVIGAVVVALLWARSPSNEPFKAFANLTTFSDQEVWEAYRFALKNPGHILSYIPCFCGCVFHGDTNNRDCYIDGFTSSGQPEWDPHSAG